jgi:phosphate ABC transporter permease subunit PstA
MEADKDLFRSVLVELGLLLLLVTVTMNTLARLLLRRVGSNKPLWPFSLRNRSVASLQPVGPEEESIVIDANKDSQQRTERSRLPRRQLISASIVDRVMTAVLWSCVAFTMSMLVVILTYLLVHGVGALNWSFFTELPPSPTVRRGTTVNVTVIREVSVPELLGKLDKEPRLAGQELGPESWVSASEEASTDNKLLPRRESFTLYTTTLDAQRASSFVRERLGEDVKEVHAESETGGGLANAIVGTIQVVGGATLLAVPIGLLAAIYLSEYRPGRLAHAVRFITEQLGGVPSIVIGIFAAGLFAIVSEFCYRRFGTRLRFYGWSGVFALAVMMIPIVMRAAEEALKLVPQSLRNAAFALGSSHAQTIMKVTVPAALPAIITAIFLSIARIAGETAPLLLTAGKNNFWPRSLNDFTPTLPVYIFQFATSPSPNWQRLAWAGAFLLMVLVLGVNLSIRLLAGKRVVQASRAD